MITSFTSSTWSVYSEGLVSESSRGRPGFTTYLHSFFYFILLLCLASSIFDFDFSETLLFSPSDCFLGWINSLFASMIAYYKAYEVSF